MSETTIRVFLVDDHEVVREGLRRMLSRVADIEIVGAAATGEAALRDIPSAEPDVVLLDLRLPDSQGLEVLRRLREAHGDRPLALVLTVHNEEDLVLGAVRAGAQGYVLKHTGRDELVGAIRRIAAGGHYFSEDVMATLAQCGQRGGAEAQLTAREIDVLRLLTEGLANKEIGARLFLSVDTVKTHLGSIYRKLGVDGRAHAVAVALRRGLLE